MSSAARELLSELMSVSNPNEYLGKKYSSCTDQDKESLNAAIGELEQAGFLSVFWADNIAYRITLKNGSTEKDSIGDIENINGNETVLIIGDNNSIKNSSIGINNNIIGDQGKKGFWEKHPFALALITAIIATFIMMFSFWDKIVAFIEGLFS